MFGGGGERVRRKKIWNSQWSSRCGMTFISIVKANNENRMNYEAASEEGLRGEFCPPTGSDFSTYVTCHLYAACLILTSSSSHSFLFIFFLLHSIVSFFPRLFLPSFFYPTRFLCQDIRERIVYRIIFFFPFSFTLVWLK